MTFKTCKKWDFQLYLVYYVLTEVMGDTHFNKVEVTAIRIRVLQNNIDW